MKRLFAIVLCLLVSMPGEGRTEAVIPMVVTEVRFVGNDTTQRKVMLQEITVHPGDPVRFGAIRRSRRALMNLGLFKSVRTRLEAQENGYAVVFEVEEKYYILPIPRLDAEPEGGYSYGLELRFDNLNGLNQRANLSYRTKENGAPDGEREHELALSYRYPRLVGTPYQLDLRFDLDRRQVHPEEAPVPSTYELNDFDFGAGVSRWLATTGPSRGWKVGLGLSFEQRTHDRIAGTPGLLGDNHAVSSGFDIQFVDVAEHRYYFEGSRYGYSSTFGLPELGSDFSFERHFFYYRRYTPLSFRRYTNFNWQFRLGLANGHPFGDDAYAMGGPTTLRGYSRNVEEGNVLMVLNMEYLHPLPNYPQVRGVLFSDIGNVYPEIEDVDPTRLRPSAGVGLRWRLQSFVDVTLSVDFAWGIDENNREVYASTRRTF